MALFDYEGYDAAGKPVKGMKEAESPRDLRDALRKEGVLATKVSSSAPQAAGGKEAGGGKVSLKRIGTDDIALVTRQLATLYGARIPLVESLEALVKQIENPRLARIVSQAKDRVKNGSSLAEALREHPAVFSGLYVNMVRAGESSGALDVVLVRLADFTEAQARLRAKVTGALAYPAVMTLVGVLIIGVLFTTVIPKVTQIFSDMDVTLPFYTRALIWASDFAADYWYFVLFSATLAVLGARAWLRTPSGRRTFDRWRLTAPLFGDLTRLIAMSRFSRTLATLLASGVELLKAMEIVRNIVGNELLEEVIDDAAKAIKNGGSMSATLLASRQFPPMVCHMISVGEKTNRLPDMLTKIADTYDTQVDARVTAMTSLLEPVMIVFMGGGVAFVVAAILMPILQMNTFVKG